MGMRHRDRKVQKKMEELDVYAKDREGSRMHGNERK
jgi:hypothetical protein